MLYIQLIGILGFCLLVLSYYKKKTKEIIIYQTVSNFAYFIHYFLLLALPGAFCSLIGILRNILFIKTNINKKIIFSLMFLLYLTVTIVFYEDLYSIFPIVGNASYMGFMVTNNRDKILIGGIINSVMWFSYSIFVSSYSGMITEMILIISNIILLIRLNKKKIRNF